MAHRPRRESVVDGFREIAGFLEEHVGDCGNELRSALTIIDLYDRDCPCFEAVSPLEQNISEGVTLAALLVLAFPEVHWVFATPYSPPDDMRFVQAHILSLDRGIEAAVEAWNMGYLPLFDASGLRDRLRSTIWKRLLPSRNSERSATVPRRQHLAVAVDEEEAYTFFNGLAAFRSGYRVCGISTWRAMVKGFMGDAQGTDPAGRKGSATLAFEDVYLNFPDRPETFGSDREQRLSSLEFRDGQCGDLEPTERRVLVTVGHHSDGDRRWIWDRNREYLAAKSYKHSFVYKPVTGLYRLLRDAGLWNRAKGKPRAADGYYWPAKEVQFDPEAIVTHSAPGRILMIAECLIRRASRILKECTTVRDAVHAAVLAIEAKELLGCATPTTALEALALQHEAEVVAESLFIGVEYNLDLNNRFDEIEEEAEAVSRWFHKSRRRRSVLNAQLTIVERLANRFRALNQIEEELACLAKARRLRFDFWVREKPWPWRWAMWLPLRYVAFALSSLPAFATAVALWVVVFAGVYWIAEFPGLGPNDLGGYLSASAFFTFVLEPPLDLHDPESPVNLFRWYSILAAQGAISFTNLGLLLSHLYMIVSRR